MKRIAVAGNVALGIIVAVGVAWIISNVRENGTVHWAKISEYHAAWDAQSGEIWQSAVFTPIAQCTDIKVSKNMRLVVERQVVGDPIPVKGTLELQMLKVTPGQTAHLFDRAIPHVSPVPPGEYMITMVAACEQETGLDTGPAVLLTDPVAATIVVPTRAAGGK